MIITYVAALPEGIQCAESDSELIWMMIYDYIIRHPKRCKAISTMPDLTARHRARAHTPVDPCSSFLEPGLLSVGVLDSNLFHIYQ